MPISWNRNRLPESRILTNILEVKIITNFKQTGKYCFQLIECNMS